MRVVSGSYGGHRLKSLAGANIRPTTDKVKEFMFNMAGSCLDGETILDLFAGSGGLVIEAVSRSCSHVVCVDESYQVLKIIKENIGITKGLEKFTTIKLDADKAIERLTTGKRQFDCLFLDPPYAKQKTIDQTHRMEELGLFSRTAIIVYETDKTAELPESVVRFHQIRKQAYGIIAVTIYKKEGER